MRAAFSRPFVALCTLAAGCGASLSVPEALEITTYPAGVEFRLSVVMDSCRDACAKYDEAACSVHVDKKEHRIELDVEVGYDRSSGPECTNRCSGEVLAHCKVPSLDAGEYTVVAGGFKRTITVR